MDVEHSRIAPARIVREEGIVCPVTTAAIPTQWRRGISLPRVVKSLDDYLEYQRTDRVSAYIPSISAITEYQRTYLEYQRTLPSISIYTILRISSDLLNRLGLKGIAEGWLCPENDLVVRVGIAHGSANRFVGDSMGCGIAAGWIARTDDDRVSLAGDIIGREAFELLGIMSKIVPYHPGSVETPRPLRTNRVYRRRQSVPPMQYIDDDDDDDDDEPYTVEVELWEFEVCICRNMPPMPSIFKGEYRLRCSECLRPYMPPRILHPASTVVSKL